MVLTFQRPSTDPDKDFPQKPMDTAANNVSAQKVVLKQVYYKMF